MTWFKVDDSFPQHPKVLRIPRRHRVACVGLWTLAGGWCARNLTDGYLDEHMVDELGGLDEQADELVRVGLWQRVDGGYQFHDWTDWQPTRARVEERREAEARRKQEWRDRKRTQRPEDTHVPAGHPAGHPVGHVARHGADDARDTSVGPAGADADVRSTRPDPTRPDPSSPYGEDEAPSLRSGAGPRKRGHRLPRDFTADDDLTAWARGRGFTDAQIAEMTDRFRDHWTAATGTSATKSDWRAAWRNWVGKEDPARVRAAGPRLVTSNGQRTWSAADLDAVLGPDMWRLPQPPRELTGDGDAMWAWEQQAKREHRAQRVAAAEAKLAGGVS